MALKLYKDAACTLEVAALTPDLVDKAAITGDPMTDEVALWIKSDNVAVTYTDITITAAGDDNAPGAGEVNIQYAADVVGVAGTYAESKALANGLFTTALKVWRKVVTAAVTAPFKVTTVTHVITATEGVA